ncbi:3-oxoacyl-[acyl-carrier-protein] synthase III C-terminal domain-containing protein [Krasilnikovia sp. MM14-A1259]|uniref:3-oxoacyl-[acyl-carrier-protein] synthase III C-terminal domain-containing protein n=1 Tax=Krasilnikovia sp. MM14-A1259 TaxID=3373539 RepID=UPI00380A137A
MTDVYVDDFGYALGERKVHVTDSAAAGLLYSRATDLASAGFTWHHVCEPETTAYDLARRATAGLSLGDGVDAIVYATCLPLNGNVGDVEGWRRTGDVKHLMDFPISRMQADLGLDRAVAIGLNQQACTSMLGSIRLAGALLGAEPGWARILCVSADRFPAGSRYEQAYNLISDGAAACVVSRAPGRLRLVAAHQITNGGLGEASDDETVGSYFAYMHRLVRETLDRAGMAAGDIDWIVPQNTNEKAWQILSRLLGVDHARVWLPSLPDTGHVISADNIVNLTALLDSGRLRPGQRLLLMMAGFGLNWQSVILEVP